MPSVYLAGPISGLDFSGATGWRDFAKVELAKSGIDAFSPMRAKEYLKNEVEFTKSCVDYARFGSLSSPRGIMTRDRFDVTRCDVILVNLLGAKTVSIGTCMEIAWADLKRIPIVCAIDDNNLHDHAMINEAIGFPVSSVEEAIHVTRAILTVG